MKKLTFMAWLEPQHNRSGIMRSTSGTFRISEVICVLLVFVDKHCNFGFTDIYARLQLELDRDNALVIVA